MNKMIAIVTVASGGLGKEFVNLLIQENLDEIWVVARNTEKLNNLYNEYVEKIIVISKDLSNHQDILTIKDNIDSENLLLII